MRALIVGGGIGGLAAGIALQQAGIEVRIFERAATLRSGGAGLWLWPNALKALDCLDLLPAVQAAGREHRCSWIKSSRGHALARVEAVDTAGRPAWSLAIRRGALLDILGSQLSPQALRGSADVVGFSAAERLEVRLADGTREQGDLLIGADGIASSIREGLFGPCPPLDAGFAAARAVVQLADAPPEAEVYWGRGARFGILPVSGGAVNWFASYNAAAGVEHTAFATRFRDWPPAVRKAIQATPPEAIRFDRLQLRPPLRQWGHGPVTLLGDAAHPMTPSLGQGACQALEDAVVLGRALASCRAIDDALRDYERRRRPRASRVAARSIRMDRLIQLDSGVLCTLRDLAARALPNAIRCRMMADLWHFDPEGA